MTTFIKTDKKKPVSSFTIIKEVILNDMMKQSFIRFLILPIVFSTILYTYMEIKSSDYISAICENVKTQQDQKLALEFYFMYFFIVIFLSEVNGFLFTGVVQYICKVTAKVNYENFLTLPPQKVKHWGSGEFQTIIERKSKATSELVEIFFINLIPIILKLFFVLQKITKKNGYKAGIVLFVCICGYFFVTILIANKRAKIRHNLNNSEASAFNILQDGLTNQETIFTNQTSKYEVDRYESILSENEKNANNLWRVYYVQSFLQRIICLCQAVTIIYIAITSDISNLIKPKDLIGYVYLTGTVTANLISAGYLYSRYTQVMVRISSTRDFMLRSSKIFFDQKGTKTFDQLNIKNLSCRVGNRLLFEDVNLDFLKGEKIAIIGENGSGKSTFLKILLSYVDYEGIILLNNENIRNLSFRNIVSYIPQNNILFNETIKFNITYGSENVTDKQVYDLCQKFGMLETIKKFKNGFETRVGEKGVFLSGGEKQKILLMRAFLKNASVLLLDESTFALDQKNKMKVIDA